MKSELEYWFVVIMIALFVASCVHRYNSEYKGEPTKQDGSIVQPAKE